MIPIYPIDFNTLDQNSNTVIELVSINDQNYGEKWLRKGYCNRCGNCCEASENIFATHDGDGNPGGLEQVVPGKCAYFRWDENGLGLCVGKNTNFYRNGCSAWPSKREHIQDYPDCSYTFEKITDGN